MDFGGEDPVKRPKRIIIRFRHGLNAPGVIGVTNTKQQVSSQQLYTVSVQHLCCMYFQAHGHAAESRQAAGTK
jgi:hypothetical protein